MGAMGAMGKQGDQGAAGPAGAPGSPGPPGPPAAAQSAAYAAPAGAPGPTGKIHDAGMKIVTFCMLSFGYDACFRISSGSQNQAFLPKRHDNCILFADSKNKENVKLDLASTCFYLLNSRILPGKFDEEQYILFKITQLFLIQQHSTNYERVAGRWRTTDDWQNLKRLERQNV